MRDMNEQAFIAVHPRWLRVRRRITIAGVRVSLASLLIGIGAVIVWGVRVSGGDDPQVMMLICGSAAVAGVAVFDVSVWRRSLPTLASSVVRYATRRRTWRVRR